MGKRAESVFPRIREWMNANSWIVNEAVLLFFLTMVLFQAERASNRRSLQYRPPDT